ncbi:MAG: hypothetical protein J7M34_00070, partial [Anaerolineae bacterium]|nr:hypothetical protein [Anaerolineae bacterium]
RERGALLDEVMEVTQLHRKTLIRLLRSDLCRHPRSRQRGRTYGPEVDDVSCNQTARQLVGLP